MSDSAVLNRPPPAAAPPPPLLAIDGLAVAIGVQRAVDGVSLALAPGRTLCLVGESGCGKSLTCFAVMGLLPAAARIVAGSIRFDGKDLAGPAVEARRGRAIAMIYQDPAAALNPVLTIGRQIAEPLVRHRGLAGPDARTEAARLLDRVGIPDARRRLDDYPHQLSGGMSQRAMIAMALACRPRLLIADEPTTALDVTIQAQIIDLLRDLQAELGMALLLVTHDLGVVADVAHDVAVMYAGRVVEAGPVETLFDRPRHPYAAALLACMPRMGRRAGRLAAIEGQVPALDARPAGCAFAPRCAARTALCGREAPPLIERDGHRIACHHPVDA